jgi:prepilin-type processing-associated H-X9-DG protein
VTDAQHEIYGSYGQSLGLCAWSYKSLWKAIAPDRLYMATDCYVPWFDHWDEDDVQYDARHGSKSDSVNLLFIDGHIETTYEADIAPLRYLTQWQNSLPWYDSDAVRYN